MILAGSGFEDMELMYPYYRFQEAGYRVDVVGSKANETHRGSHGLSIGSDLSPKQVKMDDYEAVVIPGGRAPDRMRTDWDLVQILQDLSEKGKVIDAICHGPQMLRSRPGEE